MHFCDGIRMKWKFPHEKKKSELWEKVTFFIIIIFWWQKQASTQQWCLGKTATFSIADSHWLRLSLAHTFLSTSYGLLEYLVMKKQQFFCFRNDESECLMTRSTHNFPYNDKNKKNFSVWRRRGLKYLKTKNLTEIKCMWAAPELAVWSGGAGWTCCPTNQNRGQQNSEVDNRSNKTHQVKNTVFWKTN